MSLLGSLGEVLDTYTLKVGIRTITWSNTTIYINEKPLYLRGFGMHEDSDVSIYYKYLSKVFFFLVKKYLLSCCANIINTCDNFRVTSLKKY